MAESTAFRSDLRPEFDENDPFAELTRIMGHDPRATASGPSVVRPAQPVVEIDLERELLGGLDVSDDAHVDADLGVSGADNDDLAFEFDEAFADEVAQSAAEFAQPVSWVEEAGPVDTMEAELLDRHHDGADRPGWTFVTGQDDGIADEALPHLQGEHPEAPSDFMRVDEADSHVEAALNDADFDLAMVDMDFDAPDAVEEYREEPAVHPVAFEPPAPVAVSAAPVVAQSIEDELEALLSAADAGGSGNDFAALPVERSASGWEPATPSMDVTPVEDDWEPVELSHDFYSGDISGSAAGEEAIGSLPYSDFRPAPAAPFDPFAELSSLGTEAIPVGRVMEQPAHQAHSDTQFRPHDDMPDIETLDVGSTAVPLTEDLELPDLAYDLEQPAAPLDDFESDFAEAFEELQPAASVETQPQIAMSAGGEPVRGEFEDFDLGIDYASLSPVEASRGQLDAVPFLEEPYGSVHADAGGYAGADVHGYDPDYGEQVGQIGYDEETAPPSRRRGAFLAAAVAGVAVLGGLGVFALSFGGGGDPDAPAIVRADDGPVKIRPENPGGAAVPNQDNMVYNRVAGEQGAESPAQQQLVSADEEPVDLTARAGSGLPGVESPELPVKAEDRLDPATQIVDEGVNDELVAIAPRRVRTMVVRPDGSIVPRDDLAEEELAAAGELGPVAGAGEESQLLPARVVPVDRILPDEPAAEDDLNAAPDEGPTVATPPTAPVATPRPAARETRPAAETTRVAAADPQPVRQPAAPAAAGSEWSMQIASQPTSEGAQASYQDLARRYGNVIGGKGVNIVRADIPGKGTYYRVRIPSASRDEAVQLCTRYKAAGGSCFVSK